ncbi:LapA family protein [Tomitella cavernea]|uniref:Lipopolysaccharide assembly protein A domain-containing protein n=1 Tax=Tomitella cavernea TaxID=1387982 RepID=A0ABP9CRH1_9ACTN|nr:lipopolysaccharide assembly protein LapA domain-containing protein [Tomitella cavernea]
MSTDDQYGTPSTPSTGTDASPAGADERQAAAHTPADGATATADTTASRSSKQGRKRVDLAKNSRTARAWVAWIVGAIILIFLLIFIIQNSDSTPVQIFGWEFSLPLGVTILLAAIGGALITALIGAARMLQMRRAARKQR